MRLPPRVLVTLIRVCEPWQVYPTGTALPSWNGATIEELRAWLDDLVKAGFVKIVEDVKTRDAIIKNDRHAGMIVHTQDYGHAWVLGPGLTNQDWSRWP